MMASRTPTDRPDHHVWPIAPRVLRALSPPVTASGRTGSEGNQRRGRGLPGSLVTDGLRGQLEHRAQLTGGQLGQPALPVADHEVGEGLLLLDHLVDLLFQGPGADELAHLNVALLPDTEGTVGGLVLHRRVPPPVEMHHMVTCGSA